MIIDSFFAANYVKSLSLPSEIVPFPRSFFNAVFVKSVSDTLLVFDNALLFFPVTFKQRSMLSFHPDSLHKTVVIEDEPDNHENGHDQKQKFFWIGTDNIP